MRRPTSPPRPPLTREGILLRAVLAALLPMAAIRLLDALFGIVMPLPGAGASWLILARVLIAPSLFGVTWWWLRPRLAASAAVAPASPRPPMPVREAPSRPGIGTRIAAVAMASIYVVPTLFMSWILCRNTPFGLAAVVLVPLGLWTGCEVFGKTMRGERLRRRRSWIGTALRFFKPRLGDFE